HACPALFLWTSAIAPADFPNVQKGTAPQPLMSYSHHVTKGPRAEEQRQQAELARDEAEKDRVSAECLRTVAERFRTQAEEARKAAEDARRSEEHTSELQS